MNLKVYLKKHTKDISFIIGGSLFAATYWITVIFMKSFPWLHFILAALCFLGFLFYIYLVIRYVKYKWSKDYFFFICIILVLFFIWATIDEIIYIIGHFSKLV
jgi:hypothetical protein